LQGGSAKSGRYRYYACYNKLTKGSALCSSRFLRQDLIERAVLTRIRDFILTEPNFNRLRILINEEIAKVVVNRDTEITLLNVALGEKRKRLERLYDSLETGALELLDIAPRIKRLRGEIEELENSLRSIKSGFDESSTSDLNKISEAYVREAVMKLRETLESATFAQQKQFLRSFILKIEYSHPTITIHYTFPLPSTFPFLGNSPQGNGKNSESFSYAGFNSTPEGDRERGIPVESANARRGFAELGRLTGHKRAGVGRRSRAHALEVLGIDKKGSSGRTRTYNPPVNSCQS